MHTYNSLFFGFLFPFAAPISRIYFRPHGSIKQGDIHNDWWVIAALRDPFGHMAVFTISALHNFAPPFSII
jgi:hypothetical protein